jgi:hypothetical protein
MLSLEGVRPIGRGLHPMATPAVMARRAVLSVFEADATEWPDAAYLRIDMR